MKKGFDTPIITEIEEKHGNIHTVLRSKKQAQGYTLQDVADGTGISFDNVSKFFAGKLKNPNVYNVMALCIFLKESLDSLLGNPYGNGESLAHNEEVAELKAEIRSLKKELEYTERLLAEKDAYEKSLLNTGKFRQMLIYCLMAACAILGVVLYHYIRLDNANPETTTHPLVFPALGVVIIGVTVVAALEAVANMKKDEKDDGE